jgi:hypothetical protein
MKPKKAPRWKPQKTEMFYTVYILGDVPRIASYWWENEITHRVLWRSHNVFRLRRDAHKAMLRVQVALRGCK